MADIIKMQNTPIQKALSRQHNPFVVGIGSSAGGLEALQSFFHDIVPGDNIAYVVVSHLDPNSKTLLPEILSKSTKLSVEEAVDAARLKSGHVYIAPGHSLLTLIDGIIHLTSAPRREDRRAPIDQFFNALAAAYGNRSAAVILSGSGTDGALGLKAVNRAGGLTVVQSPHTAGHEGMPQTAVDSETADFILPPEEMHNEILAYVRNLNALTEGDEEQRRSEVVKMLPEICDILFQSSGQDFKHYKINTQIRRILRRVQLLHLGDVADYVDILKTDPNEADQLFKDLLINVTSFFRDPKAFDALSEQILPKFFENIDKGKTIRVWVPGCSTGEEAYTLAILLKEQMDGLAEPNEVQIFATDIDDDALQIARAGKYPIHLSEQISPERLTKFFIKKGQSFEVQKQIRDLVLFSKHNLINDPPFSKIDLISCRNLLIYLGSYLQKKLIPLFHYSLNQGGYLFLGPSENLNNYRELFRTVDAKNRISVRLPGNTKYMGSSIPRSSGITTSEFSAASSISDSDTQSLMEKITFNEFAPKSVVVDENAQIICGSGNLEKYLTFAVGAFQNNIFRLAREGIRMGLRSALSGAIKTGQTTIHDGLSLHNSEGMQRVKITVHPMANKGGEPGLFYIAFQDIGSLINAGDGNATAPLEEVAGLVEQLERELAGTRGDLEQSIQELEAANEELKSGNEELLSMNEELQSTNEELETAKDELVTSNDSLLRANTDLENLFTSTQLAALFLDSEGKLRQITPAALSIYSIRRDDVGRPLADFNHHAKNMPPLPDFETVTNAIKPFEDEIQLRDGRYFLRRVLPYHTNAGVTEGIVITYFEITERKRRDAELALLASVVESSGDAIKSIGLDGTIITWNKAAEDLFGYTADEAIGNDLTILGAKTEEINEKIAAVKAGKTFRSERVRYRKDGSPVEVSINVAPIRAEEGTVVGMSIIANDISDRREQENRLRESEENFRTLADSISQMAWTGKADGYLNWYNARWYQYTGKTHEEMEGWGWQSVHDPKTLPKVMEKWQASIARGELFEMEFPLLGADGQFRIFLTRAVPLKDSHGRVTRWFGTNTDISELKFAEEMLHEAKLKAETANQSKSEFLANMSHEIRTPLNAIVGLTDIMMNFKTDKAKQEVYLRTLKDSAHALMALVNDVLDFAKIEADMVELEYIECDLRELCEECLRIVGVKAQEKKLDLRLSYNIDRELLFEADCQRIKQMLMNLLSNAIKFTEQGSVTVTVSGDIRADDTLVTIQVKDTGTGISADKLEHVFDKFTQEDSSISRKYGGTGIGLAITRNLADIMGGKVWAESKEGEGASVFIQLPLKPANKLGATNAVFPESEASVAGVQPTSINDKLILLAEDYAANVLVATTILEELGYRYEIASNGNETLIKWETGKFDLVLMDMQMPGMDGFETTRRIRAQEARRHLKRTPIIAVTAHALQGDREKCLLEGMDDYIAKPFNQENLRTKLAKLLD